MSDRPILTSVDEPLLGQSQSSGSTNVPLVPGTVLRNRYRVAQVVGQGGMGNVYRAEDMRLPGRLCAIKEVTPDMNQSEELREQAHNQFLQEASILAQLDHPNLPKVSDFFDQNGRDYLIMDYVPGKDLKQLLEESRHTGRKLDLDEVMGWSTQIIDALTYLHQRTPPVVHRDIKPSNIKLTPENRIKLVDFGLVKLLAADEARTITVVQGRGTALYTPLEQYGGDSGHTDIRTDIYAFGATLYHLLTDYPPADAKSRFLNARALQPIAKLNPHVPPHVVEAIMWAMEMHPNERPQTIDQFAEVFFGKLSRPKPESPNSISQALRSNWYLIALSLVLLILAITLTIL